jgi:hypothetical protein
MEVRISLKNGALVMKTMYIIILTCQTEGMSVGNSLWTGH